MISARAFIVALLLCYVAAEDAASDVVILTSDNFDSQIAQGAWLLEFYAPWCGHCKNLAPTYEKLATAVKGQFNVGKMDCTTNQETCSTRFNVRGYPTIKFYKDNVLYDFMGTRSQEALTEFMETGYTSATSKPLPPKAAPAATRGGAGVDHAHTGPTDVQVLTDKNFHTLTAQGDWLLKFYAPWCGHCKNLAPVFEQAATKLKGKANLGKIDCTTEKDVCAQYDIKGYPTLYHIKDGQLREYRSGRSLDSITSFVENDWKNVEATPLPSPPSVITLMVNEILSALEHAVQTNIWGLVAGCIAVGVILGLFVVWLVPGVPEEKKEKKEKKPKTAAEPAAENDEAEQTEKPKKKSKQEKKQD